jgi:iduronate 2-sulfatase
MKAAGHVDDVPYSWSAPPYHPPTHKNKNAKVCNNSDTAASLPDDGALHANLVCPVVPADQPGGDLPDTQTATEAVRLLKHELPAAQPFLLAVGFHKPHVPLKFPREILGRYPLPRVPALPPAAATRPAGMPPVAWDTFDDVRSRDDVAALDVPWPYGALPADFSQLVRRAYAGCVSHMDDQVTLDGVQPVCPVCVCPLARLPGRRPPRVQSALLSH